MTDDVIWLIESPEEAIEGDVLKYSVTWEGASSLTSPTLTVYRDGTDVTVTVVSGSTTASGNVLTLGTITAQANDGGKTYVAVVKATVDSASTEQRKFAIQVVKPSAED